MLNNFWRYVEIPRIDRVKPPKYQIGDVYTHSVPLEEEGNDSVIGIITGVNYISEHVLMPNLECKGHVWRFTVIVYAGNARDNRKYPFTYSFDHLAELEPERQ